MRTALLFVLLAACSSKPTCPVAVPANGSSCGDRGLGCESGGGAHQRCSTIYSCDDALDPSHPTGTTWAVTADPTCSQTNDPQCPSDFNTVPTGKACPAHGLSCDYSAGRCSCVTCNPSTDTDMGTPQTLAWKCRPWNDTAIGNGCPSDRPALGSKCEVEGEICTYSSACLVSFGPDMVCHGGLWAARAGAARPCATPVCGLP